MFYNPPGSLSMGILQARILEWVAMPSSRGYSLLRDQTQVSGIVGRFFTVWASREAMNTGVGSLSLLQGIFLMQEMKQSLLHCRPILYQLSYQDIEIGASIHPDFSSFANSPHLHYSLKNEKHFCIWDSEEDCHNVFFQEVTDGEKSKPDSSLWLKTTSTPQLKQKGKQK